MDKLIIQQRDAMRSVERALDNFKKVGKSNYTYGLVRNRLATLKENFARCQNLHNQILTSEDALTKAADSYLREDRILTCEDCYTAAADYMTEWLVQLEPKSTSTSASPDHATSEATCKSTTNQLPRIHLPEFSGNYNDWESFRDKFTTLVIADKELSDVSRLHYLSSCLKNEAADVLRNLQITNDNFAIAWKLLLSRYDNKRRILNVHLHALTHLPSIAVESASALRALYNKANKTTQSLKNLGRPVETWDDIIVYLVTEKLDPCSRKAWELLLAGTDECPTCLQLDNFLLSRIGALEAFEAASPSERKPERPKSKAPNIKPNNSRNWPAFTSVASTVKCPKCQENHFLSQCPAFRDLSVSERNEFVRQTQRCLNCFSSKHKVSECTNKHSCRTCQQRHHTLLHRDLPTLTLEGHLASSDLQEQLAALSLQDLLKFKGTVLLATAWVQVGSPSGRHCRVRALLDQGSVTTIITENLAQQLKAPRAHLPISLTGVGDAHSDASQVTIISIAPCREKTPAFSTIAVILKNLTSYSPCRANGIHKWTHIQSLNLADADPMSSHPIDIIIGADIYGSILRPGLRNSNPNEPAAQNTVFGWTLSGRISDTPMFPANTIHSFLCNVEDSLDQALRRFWEVEDIPRRTHLTPREERCEEHFVATHYRDTSGRYVVRLPFADGPPIDIGSSRLTAEMSLYRLEKRFSTDAKLAAEYNEFLKEYHRLGHMKEITSTATPPKQSSYIPHHPVIRTQNLTSRLRVVFDASRRTSNGTSLNHHLLTGPKLQTDLPSIILRWKQYRYVYTADIEKMYRQILVNAKDLDYQRILWRPAASEKIREFQLQTVTYGTACAPFLALRVLQQLVNDEGPAFPLAIPVLRHQTYVDDCVFGAHSKTTVKETRDQVTALLHRGGFKLRKWTSNCTDLLDNIPSCDLGYSVEKSLRDDDNLKILGIAWSPDRDNFTFKIEAPPVECKTKRQMLSVTARIFDPLGWVTPGTIVAKILLQKLWLHKLHWDDTLPDDLLVPWERYCAQLPLLKTLEIPRWTGHQENTTHCELHGFADASTVAYAAAIYLRVQDTSGNVTISLLAAKSKVAPLKPLSVPRLELSAALLLARTMEFVRSSLDLQKVPCYCWTDSTITLAWLRQHPAKWKTFVANRTAEIHSLLPKAQWRHVSTHHNPADCASRGLSMSDLLTFRLWWKGPEWLRFPEPQWPSDSPPLSPDSPLEEKPVTVLTAYVKPTWDLSTRFSSWSKLIRVTAYVMRFVTNAGDARTRQIRDNSAVPTKSSPRLSLTAPECHRAKVFWLRVIQSDLFSSEKQDLSSSRPLEKGSPLLSLNPFLDSDGLIRVGGRLKHSLLTEPMKHPIILASHPLCNLLVTNAHLRALHSGPQLTLRTLREEYWILRARQLVRACLYRCIPCARERAAVPTELMGNLPRARVTRSVRPFVHCGVDYAGPVLIRATRGRGYRAHKAYIALFVCLSTRAIHLELVCDYTTAAFLAAFARFCSRRGLPSAMYSDNGTTFQGADRELTSRFNSAISDTNFQNKIATDKISWHFIPPTAPHFGGLWEAGVRSVKHHLKRVVGAHTLTIEEFTTLLCQVEACLNSRPIASMTDDVNTYDALTPGHFLIGSALIAIPEPTLLDVQESRLSRWQLLRQMQEGFWKSWAHDYLHTLQQRPKWRVAQQLAKPGRMVLLRNPLLPPSKWELGRISQCHPGDDGLTRVVTVKTANSSFKRPINKLCFLPIDQENEADAAAHGGRSL